MKPGLTPPIPSPGTPFQAAEKAGRPPSCSSHGLCGGSVGPQMPEYSHGARPCCSLCGKALGAHPPECSGLCCEPCSRPHQSQPNKCPSGPSTVGLPTAPATWGDRDDARAVFPLHQHLLPGRTRVYPSSQLSQSTAPAWWEHAAGGRGHGGSEHNQVLIRTLASTHCGTCLSEPHSPSVKWR